MRAKKISKSVYAIIAGIALFTASLLAMAGSVYAVDFNASFSPATSAVEQDASVTITISFDRAIYADAEGSVFTEATLGEVISLQSTDAEGATIPFTATINEGNTEIAIDPTDILADGIVYVAISNAYYDGDGMQGDAESAIFSIAAPVEPIAPADTTETPTDPATPTTPIAPAESTTPTPDPASLADPVSPADTTETPADTTTTDQVSPTDATDTTAPADTTPPTVTFAPTGGATITDATTHVVLTFSEPVYQDISGTVFDATTLATLVTLKNIDADGADISFTASIDIGNTTITVDPTSDLEDGAIYVAISDAYYNGDGIQGSTESTFFSVATPTEPTAPADTTETPTDPATPTTPIAPAEQTTPTPDPASLADPVSSTDTTDTTVPVDPPTTPSEDAEFTVTSTPANNEVITDNEANITLTFNQPAYRDSNQMPFTTNDLASFVVLRTDDVYGYGISFEASMSDDNMSITIDPVDTLQDGDVYVAISEDYYSADKTRGVSFKATFSVDTGTPPPLDDLFSYLLTSAPTGLLTTSTASITPSPSIEATDEFREMRIQEALALLQQALELLAIVSAIDSTSPIAPTMPDMDVPTGVEGTGDSAEGTSTPTDSTDTAPTDTAVAETPSDDTTAPVAPPAETPTDTQASDTPAESTPAPVVETPSDSSPTPVVDTTSSADTPSAGVASTDAPADSAPAPVVDTTSDSAPQAVVVE